MKSDMELSFNINDEKMKKIRDILTQGGVRHYLLTIANSEELDVVEYSEYQKLEQENQQLKIQISAREEEYIKLEKNWNELKKQNDENVIVSYTQKMITEIISKNNKETLKVIEKYCEENNIIPNIIEKEKLDLILRLGIAEYNKRKLEEKQ